ncbi:hypothetical protein D037_3559A, partial [Vibrio parahaemolyticus IDH02640]
MCTRVVAANCA